MESSEAVGGLHLAVDDPHLVGYSEELSEELVVELEGPGVLADL